MEREYETGLMAGNYRAGEKNCFTAGQIPTYTVYIHMNEDAGIAVFIRTGQSTFLWKSHLNAGSWLKPCVDFTVKNVDIGKTITLLFDLSTNPQT